MPEADAPNPANPIHSSDGARDYGFRAALVGGATIYGWCVPAIIDAAGMAWLEQGWVDVAFRRPVFPNDVLTVRIDANGTFEVRGEDDRVRIDGHVGLGDATWLAELTLPTRNPRNPPQTRCPRCHRTTYPSGVICAHVACRYRAPTQKRSAAKNSRRRWHASMGTGARSSRVARQSAHLLAASFVCVRPRNSHREPIQHRCDARVGPDYLVLGRCVDAFERNAHRYIVNDVEILGDAEQSIAVIRHTAIYQVAKSN